jgi:hypothetical protein
MIKLKVSTKGLNTKGILYVVLFKLDGKDLVKIGVTTRNIEDRVSEILTSIFKIYREFPYCRPKRFKKTTDIFEKEAILHEHFKEYTYTPINKFSGSTEFFDVPLDKVVTAYENLLEGKPLNEGE